MKKVLIIDYSAGNLFSVARAFEYLNCGVQLVQNPFTPSEADLMVLPGVGAFGEGMRRLREQGLIEPIRLFAASGKPVLGICLGMQMLFSSSEEFGLHEGLNLIPGRVLKLPVQPGLKIPHIGWKSVEPIDENSPGWERGLLNGYPSQRDFYFVHSFAPRADDPAHAVGMTRFGDYRFCSVAKRNNVHGTQFHPEKSKEAGLTLLQNFVDIAG
ncbi:MAG: imidazole glycerol phosphate synthase subunit HisH [Spirochaetales bacterium]|nr:imidazole glycerol phosphate synthase subunit HisH [Spirochaetales bacterium]